MKIKNENLRSNIVSLDEYLRRHGIPQKMIVKIKGAILNEALRESNALNIDRIYTAAALAARRHLGFGPQRIMRVLQELDKTLGPALSDEDVWKQMATDCLIETHFVVQPADIENGEDMLQLGYVKDVDPDKLPEWLPTPDILVIESDMSMKQAIIYMQMRGIPYQMIKSIRENFAADAMMEVAQLRIIKEYTALILSFKRALGFGQKRIREAMHAFDEICASVKDEKNWGDLMHELDVETGIVIRSGDSRDRAIYEYLGDDFERMVDIEMEELHGNKKTV